MAEGQFWSDTNPSISSWTSMNYIHNSNMSTMSLIKQGGQAWIRCCQDN